MKIPVSVYIYRWRNDIWSKSFLAYVAYINALYEMEQFFRMVKKALGPIIEEAKDVCEDAILSCLDSGNSDWNYMKNSTRDALRKFIFEKTRRSPVILPMFLDIW